MSRGQQKAVKAIGMNKKQFEYNWLLSNKLVGRLSEREHFKEAQPCRSKDEQKFFKTV